MTDTAKSASCHAASGKVIILSAPSGSGKSTIIEAIIGRPELDLQFSVSATCRPPRGAERDGVEYYFLTPDDFHARVEAGDFVEWEEVYPGRCYGTLRSEIDRITSAGHNVIMDIDVKGAVNVKHLLGARAVSIFIQPPSVAELRRRLEGRGTDTADQIEARVAKAELELTYAPQFDRVVVNDRLPEAVAAVTSIISDFIKQNG